MGSRHGQSAGDPEEVCVRLKCRPRSVPSRGELTWCLLQHAPPAVGRSVLQLRCLIETVLLRNTNSPNKGSLGMTEKATLLRSSGRCYGLNCVPSEVLTPSTSERDCVWR